eukprot:COSAG05_NODE_1073_length_5960_cov_3.284422_3_plen_45_part_00
MNNKRQGRARGKKEELSHPVVSEHTHYQWERRLGDSIRQHHMLG